MYYPFSSNSNDLINSLNGSENLVNYNQDSGVTVAGNSVDFTQSNSSSIIVGDDNLFSFTDGVNDKPFTISLWFKTVVAQSLVFFISKRQGSLFDWQFVLINGDIRLYLGSGNINNRISGGINYNNFASNSFFDNIICTYDGSGLASGIKIYINNNTTSTNELSLGNYTGMTGTSADVIIGKSDFSTGQSLNGWIDELAFWDRDLTASECSNVYNKGIAGQLLI